MTVNNPNLSTTASRGLRTIPGKLRRPSALTLGIIVSCYFLAFFNQHFFTAIGQAHGTGGIHHQLFMVSAGLLAAVMINLFVTLPSFRYLFKTWLILLLLTGALAEYFVNNQGIIIDRDMIQNIMQADCPEASKWLNIPLMLHVLCWGGIPALAVACLQIRYKPMPRALAGMLVMVLISTLVIALTALAFYQDYASVFRANRSIRGMIVPVGYVYSLYSYERHQLRTGRANPAIFSLDSHAGPRWADAPARKVVTLLVIGETARADHFSLNGYARRTNPQLEQEDIINFYRVKACDTSTAISLRCMFSRPVDNHANANGDRHSENLLDVILHAGFSVLWRDNNTGCKGLCDRVPYEDMSVRRDPALCTDRACFDMILLQDLQREIDRQGSRSLIVLHQNGSHGPAYFQQVPDPFLQFTPYCRTGQLPQCSQTEIVNAYDSTILYTDYVLANSIRFLRQHASEYDSTLVYVSDHGESLGEHNLYLHGIPNLVAPEQQTHIPFLLWMSDGFAARFGIDRTCVKARSSTPYSHDNLFDTLLGLLNIETGLYRPATDILAGCVEPVASGTTPD